MKYSELLEMGRRMSAEERQANLRSLLTDPRCAAVVSLIEDDKTQFVSQGSAQKMAAHPGSLAHCMGSVHALEVLEGQLRQIADVPAGREAPPEE